MWAMLPRISAATLLVAILLLGLAATGFARSAEPSSSPPALKGVAAGCSARGGQFNLGPWRAPSDALDGYFCVLPAGTPSPQAAADETRCETVFGGVFVEIAVTGYSGYACTWPK